MIHLTFQIFWVFVTWVGTTVFWLLLPLSITFFIPWQNTIFGMFVLWHVCSSCSWLTAPPTAEPRNSSDRGMEQTEGMELLQNDDTGMRGGDVCKQRPCGRYTILKRQYLRKDAHCRTSSSARFSSSA